jgi:hypothetical protein
MRTPPTTAPALGLVVAALCASLTGLCCEELPSGSAHSSVTALRGFALATWSRDGYASPQSEAAIDRLDELGTTHLMLVATAYQDTRTSSSVALDSALTPSMASLAAAAAYATSRGLAVTIKPHVDVRDGSWRGTIEPADVARWFDSYRDFLVPLADFAQSAGAVTFVVGTELGGTVRNASEWQKTIAMVRSHFSGQVTYAASWDESATVPFWADVDCAGIDAYFPITSRNEPGRLEILAGWQLWLDRLEQLHRKTGKPILITEIGYRSMDGAGMAPYEFRSSGNPDPGEQADLYWAAIEALGTLEWVEGIYWWNVQPGGPVDDQNTEYSPLGKPAENELRLSWSSR